MSVGDKRRRMLGGIFLAIALGMLILGQTALRFALKGIPFVLYWLVCMLFTFLALVVAILDATIVRRRGLAERRELLQKTIGDIAREKRDGKRNL